MKHKTRSLRRKVFKQCQVFYELEQKKSSTVKTIQDNIYSVPQKVGHNTMKGNEQIMTLHRVGLLATQQKLYEKVFLLAK